ncbi:hypothetical protein BDW02DRAFT_601324 [Decorospora gaudefroyi]|uniref:Uncharacterized protein n=1 Tax=Decorospora gaudefroyi TaxID=184978 RepID=A0A6A5K3A6_9PLEO|nr:hypothetical protein BDW02DRAFT_601324 [Decorospora gaudefroyi]
MSDEVYTGFWLNHDRSAVTGSTLTLSAYHAALLTSALTFIISTVVVDSIFGILIICLYFFRPLRPGEDNLIWETYVTLRNSASAPIPSLEFLRSFLSSQSKGRPRKIVSILSIAWLSLLALKTGGFAIPQLIISTAPSSIGLSKPLACGFVPIDPPNDTAGRRTAAELYETVKSRQYASERYGQSASQDTTQPVFPVATLPFNVSHNVTCPFDERPCSPGFESAISFDTGLLDSHKHLGINAPSKDRIQYRWRSTCTPLNVTGKVTVLKDTTFQGLEITAKEPLYMVNLSSPSATLAELGGNTTFGLRTNMLGPGGYYVRTVSTSSANRSLSSFWNPIEGLRLPDSDITLALVVPKVTYREDITDAIFRATERNVLGQWPAYYTFRIIACVDQRQFCDPSSGVCSAMNTTVGDWSSPFSRNGASARYATGLRLSHYAMDNVIDTSVRSLGDNALIARSLLATHNLLSPGLLPNHWELETQRWFETGLARLQYQLTEYPNASYPDYSSSQTDPTSGILPASSFTSSPKVNKLLSSQCGQQRIRLNGRGQNVSVLGLSLLLAISALLFIAKMLLFWLADREPKGKGMRQRWQENGVLELWRACRRSPETSELIQV